MDVILLERIAKLGQMGDIVSVKSGYARNFLLPQGKALRANEANKKVFEGQRVELEARNNERKADAEKVKSSLDGSIYIIIRSAGQTGQLYGSVTPRDIAAILDENDVKVAKNQVSLLNPIKVIGVHELEINLHPEVSANISVNVARSEDEAERQAAGEDLTGRDQQFEHKAVDFDSDDGEAEVEVDLSEVFDNPDEVELDDGSDAAAEEALVEEAPTEEAPAEETSEEEAKS